MSLNLSPYIGKGTRHDPFMPIGFDQPGASAIDLRADGGATLDGSGFPYALLWLPTGSVEDRALIKLGDSSDEPFALASKLILSSKLSMLDFRRDVVLSDCVSTMLIAPPKNGWKPLMPANGRLEAWLGSEKGKQRWVDQPVLAGGSLTDIFTRANETPIAAPWTKLSSGTINLSSNAITKITSGDCFYYYDYSGGWNADQSSEFLYAASVTNDDWGPAVRIGTNGFSGYLYDGYSGGQLSKFVAGAYSFIENGAASPVVGQTVKIQVTGSTIIYAKNGTPDANSPVTDTAISTAGNGAGVFWYEAGGSLDNWVGTGEIAGGGGAIITEADGYSAGSAMLSCVWAVIVAVVLAASGLATSAGVVAAQVSAAATSSSAASTVVAGTAVATAIVSSGAVGTSAGIGSALSAAVWSGACAATADGLGDNASGGGTAASTGTSTATAAGAERAQSIGLSSGGSTAVAKAAVIRLATAQAAGLATLSIDPAVLRPTVVQASGLATLSIDPAVLSPATGAGIGEGLAAGLATWRQDAIAVAAGVGVALGDSSAPVMSPVTIIPASSRTYTFPASSRTYTFPASSRIPS